MLASLNHSIYKRRREIIIIFITIVLFYIFVIVLEMSYKEKDTSVHDEKTLGKD
jgi:uncharacterized membrane protein